MNPQSDSKIVVRAKILQIISAFKEVQVPRDEDILAAIDCIKSLPQQDLVLSILLKELSGDCTIYDSVLSIFIIEIFDKEKLGEKIFELLQSKNISDVKKLYLINLLSETGRAIDFDFVSGCVQDAQEAINIQTKKFLQEAFVSPETQIDFYDFYFTVNEFDKELLVNSMVSDYSGDELANILAPMLYFSPNIQINKELLSIFGESKSYIALNALEHFVKNTKEDELKSFARKQINILRLAGLRENTSLFDVYKTFLSDSKPLGFWFSYLDGRSNLPCVFAREHKDGTIQTFFTVLNIDLGVVSCFGFDKITKQDFETILSRFFAKGSTFRASNSTGKLIFDTLSSKLWGKKRSNFPYEFVCWRQLTFDIEPQNVGIESVLTQGLKQVKTKEKLIYEVLNSSIFSSWFYKYDDLEEFYELINEINSSEPSVEYIEKSVETCLYKLCANIEFISNFKFKYLLQAYLCKNTNMENAGNLLYSISLSEDDLILALRHTIKKSVYEHYFALCHAQKNAKKTIFTKKHETKQDKSFENVLKVIESAWV